MNDTKKSAVGVGAPATEKEINSENIITQAIEKINSCKGIKNLYASAIAEPVKRALQDFCRQQEEFARAVIDGGTTEDCINQTAKSISGKTSVSDFDVFQHAISFYFPGAVLEYKMLIHMSEYELEPEMEPAEPAEPAQEQRKSIGLSLDSLLDW